MTVAIISFPGSDNLPYFAISKAVCSCYITLANTNSYLHEI